MVSLQNEREKYYQTCPKTTNKIIEPRELHCVHHVVGRYEREIWKNNLFKEGKNGQITQIRQSQY